jgi:hypothetical protein
MARTTTTAFAALASVEVRPVAIGAVLMLMIA